VLPRRGAAGSVGGRGRSTGGRCAPIPRLRVGGVSRHLAQGALGWDVGVTGEVSGGLGERRPHPDPPTASRQPGDRRRPTQGLPAPRPARGHAPAGAPLRHRRGRAGTPHTAQASDPPRNAEDGFGGATGAQPPPSAAAASSPIARFAAGAPPRPSPCRYRLKASAWCAPGSATCAPAPPTSSAWSRSTAMSGAQAAGVASPPVAEHPLRFENRGLVPPRGLAPSPPSPPSPPSVAAWGGHEHQPHSGLGLLASPTRRSCDYLESSGFVAACHAVPCVDDMSLRRAAPPVTVHRALARV
jgi:hypothetical protein